MLFLNEFIKHLLALKELRNYVLRIIHASSSFFTTRVYLSLHFVPIVLVNYVFLSAESFQFDVLFTEFITFIINVYISAVWF